MAFKGRIHSPLRNNCLKFYYRKVSRFNYCCKTGCDVNKSSGVSIREYVSR